MWISESKQGAEVFEFVERGEKCVRSRRHVIHGTIQIDTTR